MTTKKRLGRCYELAAKEVILIDTWHEREPGKPVYDAVLVHGTIGPERNPHAWVEFSQDFETPAKRTFTLRLAWEPVMEQELPVDAFDRLMYAERIKTYTPKQAAERLLSTHHYGPWE